MRRFSILIAAAISACEPPPVATEARALAPARETCAHPESDVLGAPAILRDGAIVVSRRGENPGESDLWITRGDREPERLFPGPGADDRPFALPDGRVVFVSSRTTVASLWIGDPATGELTQLTNRGLSAGRPWGSAFVPPPRGELSFAGDRLRYDDQEVIVEARK